jgi:nocardicin N-oxygenase
MTPETATDPSAAPAASAASGGCPVARSYPFHRPSAIEIPPVYAELRISEPVARVTLPSGDLGYVVSRHEDAKMVLADPRFSRAAMLAEDAPQLTVLPMPPGSLFTTDPPEHTRLRKLVTGVFTARRIRELEPRIQQLTDELLDRMEASGGPVDLNQTLAFPLPVQVICELLGVPFEDREQFRAWSNAIVSLTTHTAEQMMQQRMEMAGYINALIERRRGEPGEDLLSALIAAHDEEDALGQGELVIMAMTLLVAGHETTVSMIGACVLTLLRHPEHLDSVINDPDAMSRFVAELLRINPIGDGGPLRITLEDVEIAGTVIPKGSALMAAVCAANRDPEVFDHPEDFDPNRTHNPHLAYGHGIHHCLGAALANAELRITIGTLFRRFPTLRLAAELDSLRMKPGMLVHGLESLPVDW